MSPQSSQFALDRTPAGKGLLGRPVIAVCGAGEDLLTIRIARRYQEWFQQQGAVVDLQIVQGLNHHALVPDYSEALPRWYRSLQRTLDERDRSARDESARVSGGQLPLPPPTGDRRPHVVVKLTGYEVVGDPLDVAQSVLRAFAWADSQRTVIQADSLEIWIPVQAAVPDLAAAAESLRAAGFQVDSIQVDATPARK